MEAWSGWISSSSQWKNKDNGFVLVAYIVSRSTLMFQRYMLRSLLTQSFNIVNTPIILLFSKKWVPGFAAEDNTYKKPKTNLGISVIFPKTLYLFYYNLWILMTITCCYLAFSLLFSTYKYTLTGDFSWLGLNRFITSGVILFIWINEDYIEA